MGKEEKNPRWERRDERGRWKKGAPGWTTKKGGKSSKKGGKEKGRKQEEKRGTRWRKTEKKNGKKTQKSFEKREWLGNDGRWREMERNGGLGKCESNPGFSQIYRTGENWFGTHEQPNVLQTPTVNVSEQMILQIIGTLAALWQQLSNAISREVRSDGDYFDPLSSHHAGNAAPVKEKHKVSSVKKRKNKEEKMEKEKFPKKKKKEGGMWKEEESGISLSNNAPGYSQTRQWMEMSPIVDEAARGGEEEKITQWTGFDSGKELGLDVEGSGDGVHRLSPSWSESCESWMNLEEDWLHA